MLCATADTRLFALPPPRPSHIIHPPGSIHPHPHQFQSTWRSRRIVCRHSAFAIDKKIEAFFRRLGQLVYRHTYKFLFIPIVVAILLSAGLVLVDEEFDPEKLYTPDSDLDDAPSFDEQGKVEARFGFRAREG